MASQASASDTRTSSRSRTRVAARHPLWSAGVQVQTSFLAATGPAQSRRNWRVSPPTPASRRKRCRGGTRRRCTRLQADGDRGHTGTRIPFPRTPRTGARVVRWSQYVQPRVLLRAEVAARSPAAIVCSWDSSLRFPFVPTARADKAHAPRATAVSVCGQTRRAVKCLRDGGRAVAPATKATARGTADRQAPIGIVVRKPAPTSRVSEWVQHRA